MILEQAHELQRKKLISLRAENKRLKSGSFISDEKKTLEKQIRKEVILLFIPNWLRCVL